MNPIIRAVMVVSLGLLTLVLTINSSVAQLKAPGFEVPVKPVSAPIGTPLERAPVLSEPLSTACAVQPERTRVKFDRSAQERAAIRRALSSIRLERFRTPLPTTATATTASSDSPEAVASYSPKEVVAPINPTNFGDRYSKDLNGNPALLDPIVVLHETVGSASSAINLFRTPHLNDADQSSYHTLIQRDGTVVYLVPPDKRAFGAGNSVFQGPNGAETVRTHPDFPGSVNNFAYHISLETPYDGNNNGYRHSGYTQAQYRSLAWLVAQTGVDPTRVTTHKAVDRSRSRIDPRSFDNDQFFTLLRTTAKTSEIVIRCTDLTSVQS